MIRPVALALAAVLPLACRAPSRAPSPAPREVVERYLAARRTGELEAAAAMLAPDARRWFERREGPGMPWRVGQGPWARWDRFFRSTSEKRDWTVEGRAVSVVSVEVNDFYRLIERPPSPARLTWFVDEEDRLSGFLVSRIEPDGGDGSRDLLDEFAAWAEVHAPKELAHVMPQGEIRPDGDRPERWKALLVRWRAETGRGPVD